MTPTPTATRVMRVAETILAKHSQLAEPSPLQKCGLSRDEIMCLTQSMRRENFVPKQYGIAAMTEFLDAGFKDMTRQDWEKWGVTGADANRWRAQNQHRITSTHYHTSGQRSEQFTAYNWKEN